MDARRLYREAAVRGASPVRLVICLYEQAIDDLRRAASALKKGSIAARTRYINHAFLVIAQLQASLDIEHGGEVAKNLARFYSLIRTGLTDAHCRQSLPLLEQQIAYLTEVHSAWLQVEQQTETPAAPSSQSTANPPGISSPDSSFAGWSA
jgi:flagellar secretion chaperone FliS